jgi:hypothetical protein
MTPGSVMYAPYGIMGARGNELGKVKDFMNELAVRSNRCNGVLQLTVDG